MSGKLFSRGLLPPLTLTVFLDFVSHSPKLDSRIVSNSHGDSGAGASSSSSSDACGLIPGESGYKCKKGRLRSHCCCCFFKILKSLLLEDIGSFPYCCFDRVSYSPGWPLNYVAEAGLEFWIPGSEIIAMYYHAQVYILSLLTLHWLELSQWSI